MTSELDASIKRLEKKLSKIAKVETDRAYSAAANKIATRVKSRVAKAVASDVNLTQKVVKRKIFIRRSRAATGRAAITFYTRPVNAVSTNYSITRKGYKVAGRVYPRTFFAKGKSSTHQIYQRKGQARYPIDPVKIPISEAVNRHAVPLTARLMKTDFPDLLKHELGVRIRGVI